MVATTPGDPRCEAVLAFWFGTGADDATVIAEKNALWFDGGADVDAAIRVLDEENQKLDKVRAAHKEASRQKSKFVDLSHNHTNELAREAERKEDLELEEVANIKRDREDWDEYAEGER